MGVGLVYNLGWDIFLALITGGREIQRFQGHLQVILGPASQALVTLRKYQQHDFEQAYPVLMNLSPAITGFREHFAGVPLSTWLGRVITQRTLSVTML